MADNARVNGLDAVVHASGDPNAKVSGLSAVVHGGKNGGMSAKINGAWATVHASIRTRSNAIVNGAYAVVHTSIKDIPVGLLPVRPNSPVTERLSWLTDVIQNYDGTDQRIAIRVKPRRELSYTMTFENDADYKRAYDTYYYGAATAIHAPVWGYQSRVKRTSSAGSTAIYCNTYRGDFRPTDPVAIYAPDGSTAVYYVQDVYADQIVIGRPLAKAVPEGSIVVPCSRSRFADNASFEMAAIGGSSSITVRAERPRAQEAWPYKPVTLPTYDGYVIVDRRPTNAPAGHTFDRNVEVIDNETGIEKYVTAWRQTYVEGQREYMVNTLWAWDEMQFWRTLFDHLKGRQKAFLTPTYRKDLIPVSMSVSGIVVEGSMFDRLYKNSNAYRRLQIETEAGTVNVKIASVSVNNDGNTVITFTANVPSDISQSEVKRVSFLNLVRLGGDSVTITHEPTRATIGLSLRTATE